VKEDLTMPSRELPYPLFDADNHLYEPPEAMTKYLPKEYEKAIQYVQIKGRTKIAVRGQISEYIPNPTFEVVARPGAMEDYFKHGNPEGKSRREIFGEPMRSIPAFHDPAPRLEVMDDLGIERTLMFPTLASLLEERMRDDPDLIHAVVHGLNRWLEEVWGFDYKGRIFTTPVISLPIVDKAIEELNWCAERGARAILVRPAPVPGFRGSRSFALPEFDPFWQRVEDAGILVVLHASDTGYTRYSNEWEGVQGEALAFGQPQPFSSTVASDYRDIRDAVTAMICHGALTRFPQLRLALVENGSGWVPHFLEQLDHAYDKMPQAYAEKPSLTFKRHFWMHPFHEEDPRDLVKLLGADHIIFGSDFPHVEGLANPISWADELQGLPEEDIRLIMGGNMMELLGVAAKV
jgi:predicted TIM-barrel fold metal-dependent hydrolase